MMIYASRDPDIHKARDYPHGLFTVQADLNLHVHPIWSRPTIYLYDPKLMQKYFLETQTPLILGGWQKGHRGIGFLFQKRYSLSIRMQDFMFPAGNWSWVREGQSRDWDSKMGKQGEDVAQQLIQDGYLKKYGVEGTSTRYSESAQRLKNRADLHVESGQDIEVKTELLNSWNLFVQVGERYYDGTPYIHDYYAL